MIGVKWNLKVVSIYISLMIKHAKNVMISQPFQISFFRILFRSIPHFLIKSFVLLMLRFLSSLYVLDFTHLLDVNFVNTYCIPHTVGCWFYEWGYPLPFSFTRSHLLFLVSVLLVFIQKVFSHATVFKITPHFFVYQVQYILFCVKVFDPFGVELCAGWEVWIYLD